MSSTAEIFINCPKGLESLLREEALALGAEQVRETVSGVYASGDESLSYRLCLWSRLANRVLLPLARFDVATADDLYDGVRTIHWPDQFGVQTTFAVDFAGRSDAIRHSGYGAQRVKDAIVDQFQQQTGRRPDVDPGSPGIRINAHLSKGRVTVGLDLSGASLHRRGYRIAMVPAPLKENLAAAILLRAGWPEVLARGGGLIDPMCGSGTLLIEAAMMAADVAPGLMRTHYGFTSWKQFNPALWEEMLSEARERRQTGLAREIPEIRGYDKDSRAVAAAEQNVSEIGLSKVVRVSAKPLSALKKPTHRQIAEGLILTNPPYGERWGEIDELRPLYHDLGQLAKAEFPGWTLGVFTGNPDLAGELKLRADKTYNLFNGTIPAKLLIFSLRRATKSSVESGERPEEPSESVRMLANRLQKNEKRLKSWIAQNNISCFRLYDADIPEYAVAIDFYGDWIHVQEYAPPSSVDPRLARRRLGEVRKALNHLYPNRRDRIVFKERRRQSGDDQYQPLTSWDRKGGGFVVTEGPARVEVNLTDYLDSGLFLDHRPVREMIRAMADGKRFLNLFCYTAVATVQAALGGATSSLSIDMSNSYLEWAKRNFELNGMDLARHRLLRADCLQWLAGREGQYDLIFLDPPTFSNSKKMTDVLDIQRDHVGLIDHAMALLAPQGTLIFSNNFRRFKIAGELADRYHVEDISGMSIPPDFERNKKIHHCWLIKAR